MQICRTAVRVLVMVLVVGGLLTGCGRVAWLDDLFRGANNAPQPVPVDPLPLPPGGGPLDDLPPAVPGGSASAAAAQADALVAQHTSDLAADERRFVVVKACQLNDVQGVLSAESLQAAAQEAVLAAGGRPALTLRMAGLADNLQKAESSTDQLQLLVVAAVCETA